MNKDKDNPRSRSNTSLSSKGTRPHSRASTTSVRSFEDNAQLPDFSVQYPQPNLPHPYNSTYTPPVDGTNALLHAAQQTDPHQHMAPEAVQQLMVYTADSVANLNVPNGIQQSQQFDSAAYNAHAFQGPTFQQQNPVTGDGEESKRKKASGAGSATNDKELREMLQQYGHRDLKDVAVEVIQSDRGSKAEKTKQLYAMIWLKTVCRTAKTSVPRNRVYAKYADRCNTDRVIPLNPASFGKLVRVNFPGIQTRRLGVRGESKYHYVDLALKDDDGDDNPRLSAPPAVVQNALQRRRESQQLNLNNAPARTSADTAAFPPQDMDSPNPLSQTRGPSRGRLFTDIYSSRFRPTTARQTSQDYDFTLAFIPPLELTVSDDYDVVLPDITAYIPPRTDPDAANALLALYRTHCTSLVDAVRYCKEKQFFRLFASFHGTLTVPVQKLFARTEMAPWIRECDWVMYKKMIRNLAQLTLQVAPPQVIRFLDNVAKTLHQHISKVFHGLPLHVLEARLEPATIFARLLRKMLTVNQAAHAAAVLLMSDGNRQQMWSDWQTHVNYKRIMEDELPHGCANEEIYNILSTDIPALIMPQQPPADPSETVIDRIALFLLNLPTRFPHIPPRTILWCVSALGSAALREITVENGMSFQGWWLTKIFIDEMAQWLASLGGFLEHVEPSMDDTFSAGVADAAMANGSGSNHDSRYSSIDGDFSTGGFTAINNAQDASSQHVTSEQIDTRRDTQVDFDIFNTPQPHPPDQDHDDSGIGLLEDGIDAKLAVDMDPLGSHFAQSTVNAH
ncbi:hypothetical protein EJ04DRAFT_431931 [Polyplosphaeria fusca]|uniref:RFX-type winged-helix domain-containing protein n=1 Tax=Polyplosphaeria fusca TaxID=682080 RepID=A0A9P4QZW7_9PLEO|nr:hypothetical protein EJ04DRAFT_431931 [Polyplosphaeria fusca]